MKEKSLKKKKDLTPRRRPLPYRINKYKVKLPVLKPEEWFYLMVAGDDWESVETTGVMADRLSDFASNKGSPDAWKYAEWARALRHLRSDYDVIKVYMSLHAKGLVDATLDTDKGLIHVDHLDSAIITREPERYWFFAREDLREAMLELSREVGFIPLSVFLERQGQEVEVIEVIYNE